MTAERACKFRSNPIHRTVELVENVGDHIWLLRLLPLNWGTTRILGYGILSRQGILSLLVNHGLCYILPENPLTYLPWLGCC